MIRAGLTLAGLIALSACAGTMQQSATVAGPAIVAALDSQPDGFSGVTRNGERFRIVSTSASSTELCRVVSIEQSNRFAVESFCKAKGGTWR